MYCIDLLEDKYKKAAAELAGELQIPLGVGKEIIVVEGDMSIEVSDKVVISCRTLPQFCRLFGFLTGKIKGKYRETQRASLLGYMADNSRVAVLNVESAKKMLRCMASMGFNTFFLYMEDSYEIKSQPYFGHMRGRWTQNELRDIVEYAEIFGIEVIPCIQTLAHLENIKRWNCFKGLFDTDNILCVGDEQVYAFIEEMFKTCKACFKTSRINIGCDEAHMLGRGKYLDKNGYKNRSEILLEHLNRVCKIAEKYGYKPMTWSDMFFSMQFGKYYVKEGEISKEVTAKLPKNLDIVYWDYYATDRDLFSHMVDCHLQFDNKTVFAGGVHKWGGFIAVNDLTRRVVSMQIDECLSRGITEIFATGWGDDGSEASQYSIMPGLLLYADKCYKEDVTNEWLDRRYEELFGMPYEPFRIIDSFDVPPTHIPYPTGARSYFHKQFLYADVLEGLFVKHTAPKEFAEFYTDRAEKLLPYINNERYGYIVNTCYWVARVLAYKSTMANDLRSAYKVDNVKLLKVANEDIPACISALRQLLRAFEYQWRKENRQFGLEITQSRIGGLIQRLSSTADIINMYVNGEVSQIDELEQEPLYIDCRAELGNDPTPERNSIKMGYKQNVSVNII